MTVTMTSPQTPLSVLKAARELLSDPAKWTQGSFEDENGCLCAIGAVFIANARLGGANGFRPAEELSATLGRGATPHWRQIVEFNDAPERTHAEILALFDTTISRLESEASS